MKTLVIPDIHQHIQTADRILHSGSWDHVVLLGDIWDDWDDTWEQAVEAATWLAATVADPHVSWCLGNHDAHYVWPEIYGLRSSGYTYAKALAIQDTINISELAFVLYVATENHLLSHAGIHPAFLSEGTTDYRVALANLQQEAYAALERGTTPALLAAGRDRGGFRTHGGITWLDWGSFRPIPGINQIVGHTNGRTVRERHTETSRNWCLDTNLHNYAVITDGDVEIRRMEW